LPRISDREFLLKAGQAGLGLILVPQLVALAGCGGSIANTVTDASVGYNGILIQTNPSEVFG
jgi:hypothetical protein